MKPPPLLCHVASISGCEPRGAYWSFEIGGIAAWYRDFAGAACVAMQVPGALEDDAWLVRAALWLASMRAGLDDSLLLEADRLWFARRYAHELEQEQGAALLRQQLAVVRWLGVRWARSDAIARAGTAGVWA